MLKTRALHFTYDERNEFHFPDINLDEGADLLILGESGIGKTTLLHLIAGLLPPKSGIVELLGTKLQELSASRLDRFRGAHIGLVFQRPHFIQALTIQDNLALVQFLAGKKKDIRHIKDVLDSLGIGDKLLQKPSNLSQGEQQRAAIALAVINSPALLLADEPTSSLDDTNCAKVTDLLKKQAADTGSQLVIITHDQRLKSQFQNTLTL